MICANCGREVATRPFAYALGRRLTELCDTCVDALRAMGMSLTPIERRVVDVPVARNRRRFVPAWLRNLTARDETGRVIAA